MKKIGTTLKVLRTKAGFSQKALARSLNISQNYLSLIENDHKMPSLGLLNRIAVQLGLPLSYIFLSSERG